jgi:hypothetical protein
LTVLAIGDEVDPNTGLFKKELQTFSGHKGDFPALRDFIYLRVFSHAEIDSSKWYGESELYEVTHVHGEIFYCFDDTTDDAIILNHAFKPPPGVEWTVPTASLPEEYALFQNYPNPFNPETDIQYQVPQACRVKLSIYNVLGQEIYTLVDGERAAGKYTVRWFGTDSHGRELGSGIYFYRLKAGDFVDVRKMVLLK